MLGKEGLDVGDNNTVTLIHQHPYNTTTFSPSLSFFLPRSLSLPNDSTSACVCREWIEMAGSAVYLSCALIGQGSGHMDVYLEIWLVWLMAMLFVSHRELWGLLFSTSSHFLSPSDRSWISLPKLSLDWSQHEPLQASRVISHCQANTPETIRCHCLTGLDSSLLGEAGLFKFICSVLVSLTTLKVFIISENKMYFFFYLKCS